MNVQEMLDSHLDRDEVGAEFDIFINTNPVESAIEAHSAKDSFVTQLSQNKGIQHIAEQITKNGFAPILFGGSSNPFGDFIHISARTFSTGVMLGFLWAASMHHEEDQEPKQ